MDSRQRVQAALDHREGDRVPLDIGGTRVTGIHREAYARFREGIGLPPRSVDALIRYLELAKVDEDFRRLFDEIRRASGGRAYLELHCCGAIRELIPDLLDVGVQVLNPVQVSAAGMDTGELKRDFGRDLVFHGGGVDSQRTLPYGTPDEVRTEVTRRMLELAPDGGFIFTPVHSIQHDVPFANFASMLDGYRATARVGDQTASP